MYKCSNTKLSARSITPEEKKKKLKTSAKDLLSDFLSVNYILLCNWLLKSKMSYFIKTLFNANISVL